MKLSYGITLIELLVALALIVITLIWTFPSTKQLQTKNQLEASGHEIAASIQFSKTQAILQKQILLLEPLSNHKDWSLGAQLIVNHSKQILHVWHWKKKGISIAWHGFETQAYLKFAPDINQSAINGYFILDSGLGHEKIIINRLGRIRFEHDNSLLFITRNVKI